MKQDSLYKLNDFDFDLPDELIAQYPAEKRDESKLFILNRNRKSFEHRVFSEISDILTDDYLLVFNNAKVIPARIFCKRETGGSVETVLARKITEKRWLILTNKMKRIRPGEILICENDDSVTFSIQKRSGDYFEIEASKELNEELLEKIGKMPLPPYIKRDAGDSDLSRYQTVYAKEGNAVAAPTAGLHFTNDILSKIADKGIQTVYLTLDVSWGTFRPVRTDNLNEHKMHSETYSLSQENADAINQARKDGRKIIAVGTTSLRVLESTYHDGKNIPGLGDTDIFIYPPYKVKSIDGLITNFHTPKSTLLMLVSAFAGYDLIMQAYQEAVLKNYRFFSYGDSMFII